MRWLLIGFAVSLVALLFAAAGLAHHIWFHHAKLRREALGRIDPAHETDLEP